MFTHQIYTYIQSMYENIYIHTEGQLEQKDRGCETKVKNWEKGKERGTPLTD